jgi:hypothetical protein
MSQINVEVIDVVIEKVKTYQKMVVTYRSGDKLEAKNLMDFAAPKPVWDAFAHSLKGDFFSVERVKNDKGYWDWVEVHRQDGAAPAAPAGAKVNNFEDKRQKYIIRQSSLAQAVAMRAYEDGGTTDVLELAEKFEQWVLREEQ